MLVSLQTVQKRNLERTITAYGKVSPDPDAVSAVNAGHEVIVSRLWVTPGQKVGEGDKLVTLETAPSARMAYRHARAEANSPGMTWPANAGLNANWPPAPTLPRRKRRSKTRYPR